MDGQNLLQPVLAMVLLHAAVWIWMTVTRARAMNEAVLSCLSGIAETRSRWHDLIRENLKILLGDVGTQNGAMTNRKARRNACVFTDAGDP